MRYHWGAGVGHIYTHGSERPASAAIEGNVFKVGARASTPLDEEEDGGKDNGVEGSPIIIPGLEEEAIFQETSGSGLEKADGSDGGQDEPEDFVSDSGSLSEEDPHSEEEEMDEMYGVGEGPDSGGVFSYD